MPTRQDVETAIETINDNGNNTAQEVRTVLSSLLDYTENEVVTTPNPNPTPSTLERFHFCNDFESIRDGQGTSNLWYSLFITPLELKSESQDGDRVPNMVFDFTLRFQVMEPGVKTYSFSIKEDALIGFLRENLNFEVKEPLRYFIPVHPNNDDSEGNDKAGILKILIQNEAVLVEIENQDRDQDRQFEEGDSAFTSIRFHLLDFAIV